MKTINVPSRTLENLIEQLDAAINVCCKVDSRSGNTDLSYPYATGYSRSAMMGIQEELKSLI